MSTFQGMESRSTYRSYESSDGYSQILELAQNEETNSDRTMLENDVFLPPPPDDFLRENDTLNRPLPDPPRFAQDNVTAPFPNIINWKPTDTSYPPRIRAKRYTRTVRMKSQVKKAKPCVRIYQIIQILFLLAGSLAVAGCIYYDKLNEPLYELSESLSTDYNHTLLLVASSVVIVTGAIAVVGCASRPKWWYIITQAILIFGALVTCVIAVINLSSTNLSFDVVQYENKLIRDYGFNDGFTKAVDKIQKTLECCGSRGNLSHGHFSWAFYKTQSEYFVKVETRKNPPNYVPKSCCVQGSTRQQCQANYQLGGERRIPAFGPPYNERNAKNNDFLFVKGCYKAINTKLKNLQFVMYTIGMGLIVTFCCMAFVQFVLLGVKVRKINRDKKRTKSTLNSLYNSMSL